MSKYLTIQELMKLSHIERRKYTQAMHDNTMRNLNRINEMAKSEIELINQIINK